MDRAVIATASELFEARHYPGVVAICDDALDLEPECLPLLVMRARAHIALRRDLDAQADLRDIIRLDPQCSLAYRLLGVLAARRDENESAAIFFREALRLSPDDHEASDWLAIVDAAARPVPGGGKFASVTSRARLERGRTATGASRSLSAPARSSPAGSQPRFARGTKAPDQDDRETKPFARGSDRDSEMWKTPTPTPTQPVRVATPLPLPPPPNQSTHPAREAAPFITIPGHPPTQLPARASQPSQPSAPRALTPELPGFGEYLVSTGILSRERLRAAQAYQRSMKVQLATAIVTLGLATPQRMEWAAVAHQSQLARDRQLARG